MDLFVNIYLEFPFVTFSESDAPKIGVNLSGLCESVLAIRVNCNTIVGANFRNQLARKNIF